MSSHVILPGALQLNSDIVMQAATKFAERLLADSTDDDRRLSQLYVIAFGREPTADERQTDRAFLAAADQAQSTGTDADSRRRQAWATLCHAALAANEFIYVR